MPKRSIFQHMHDCRRKEMQLSEGQIRLSLPHILQNVWKTTYQSIVLLGEGVFGRSYGVTFACSPYRAVVKVHKYPDMGSQENGQLIELSYHLPGLVPHVYA